MTMEARIQRLFVAMWGGLLRTLAAVWKPWLMNEWFRYEFIVLFDFVVVVPPNRLCDRSIFYFHLCGCYAQAKSTSFLDFAEVFGVVVVLAMVLTLIELTEQEDFAVGIWSCCADVLGSLFCTLQIIISANTFILFQVSDHRWNTMWFLRAIRYFNWFQWI